MPGVNSMNILIMLEILEIHGSTNTIIALSSNDGLHSGLFVLGPRPSKDFNFLRM